MIKKAPAHLVEEAVGFRHPVELVFVLLQEIHVALLWDELQQLTEQERTLHSIYSTLIHLCSLRSLLKQLFIY